MDSTKSVDCNNGELRSKAYKICGNILGGTWSKISLKEFSIVPISGGMSNTLLRCSLPNSSQTSYGEPREVLLRLYGDQARNCDMSIQLEIFNLLSSKELGPKLFGKFDDGRIEEYLPADSLTSEELMDSDVSSIIAKKLATVHSLEVPIDKSSNWLVEKLIEWTKFVEEQGQITSANGVGRGDGGARQSTIEIAKELLAIDYKEEIKFLRDLFDRMRSPTVFSHNDLHQGNILLAKYSKRRPALEERIVFIDFEYCSYNYRGYDIANHFCEWCFEYDTPDYPHFMFYGDRFPSEDVQRNFIRNYLEQKKHLIASTKKPLKLVQNRASNLESIDYNSNSRNHHHRHHSHHNRPSHGHLTNGHSNGTAINDNIAEQVSEEDALLNEIKPFLMGANLLWTLWCIQSAQKSAIKFGYWEHAMARWRMYSKFKMTYSNDKIQNSVGNNDNVLWK